MNGIRFLLALAILATPALAEPLTRGERNRALSELHATRKLLLDAIDGLSPAQWSWKPSPDRWSVGEIAEHLVLTEDYYWDQIQSHVGPDAQPGESAEASLDDEEVIRRMADRSSKRKTGEAATPTGQWQTPEAVAAEFKTRRDRLINYIRTTEDDLRSHVWSHRAVGPLDGFQWALLACGHVHRHLEQLNEVKNAPGYPAE